MLRTYSNEQLTVYGLKVLPVVYGRQRVSLPIVVEEGSGPTLLGMSHLQLDWGNLRQLRVGNGQEAILAS